MIFDSFFKSWNRKEIIENPTFAVAQIDSIKEDYSGKYKTLYLKFYYHYKFGNNIYKNHSYYKYNQFFINFNAHKRDIVKGKLFPVIASNKNLKNHQILIFWSEYSQYNLQQPDSLKWTEKVFYDK